MRGPDAFLLERDVVPRRIHRDDVESQRIDAELADDGLRLDVIPEGLVHLPAVRAVHPSVHEHLVVRGPVERHDAGRELGAEPTTGLVRPFDDPILGPPAAELVLTGRIAEARPARDPAVEPHVDRVGHPPHLAVALLARQDDPVDAGPVEVHSVHVALCLPQGVGRSDDRPMRALDAPPDRERDAPVALPRDAPISEVARPVELSRGSRPVREPGDPPDLFDHFRFDVRDLEEPLDRRTNRIGVLHRQQWPYAWTIVSSANSAWAARRSATIRGFASLTLWPAYVPASSVKRPRASTGEKAGRPSFRPSSKSSGPWPGAECTSPVYSATTVSDGTTLWTHLPFTPFWYGSFVRRGWRYASPTRSLPFFVSTTEYFVTPPRAMMSGTALSMTQIYSGVFPWGTLPFAYWKSG